MEKHTVKALAGEAIACELGLVDWQATLDFIVDEHKISADVREKVDTEIQKMLNWLFIKLYVKV